MGMNAKSAHPEETKIFLDWMTTADFATLYANALPGFFPLANVDVKLDNPVAQQFLDWRKTCKSTIRSAYQILSRGDVAKGQTNNENDLWAASAAVLNGSSTPQEAADTVQTNLDAWYKPQ